MKLGISILIIVVFCVEALAQDKKTGNEEKIPFQTKGRDACVMSASGQGEIRLKIECRNQDKTYSCEFMGKPSYCRAYNKNPKVFWNQLSEDLKKTTNACESPVLKHSMCPRAPSQSHLKQVDGSGNPNQQSDTAKPEKKPPATPKPSSKKTTTKSKSTAPENPKARKMAKENCWEFFQNFCTYMVEIFVS
ncbi:hypothetical protein FKM82_001594 [Ascaphus truei]